MHRTGHAYCNKRPPDSPEVVSYWLSYTRNWELGTSNSKKITLQRRKFFRINLKAPFACVVNTRSLSCKNPSANAAQRNNRCYGRKHPLISICHQLIHEGKIWFVWVTNIWTVPHFQRIYHLSLCCAFCLAFGSWDVHIYLVLSTFTSSPNYVHRTENNGYNSTN
jgi:hypothetical protein